MDPQTSNSYIYQQMLSTKQRLVPLVLQSVDVQPQMFMQHINPRIRNYEHVSKPRNIPLEQIKTKDDSVVYHPPTTEDARIFTSPINSEEQYDEATLDALDQLLQVTLLVNFTKPTLNQMNQLSPVHPHADEWIMLDTIRCVDTLEEI